ncbi:hypothetical protein AVEN_176753-1 [Araneus ventricosus]|uniref:Uncharacterized protein n=1 Tax=Araneus ventricosus TaxID=182803 RepID=A0A4Y2QAH4_ARAVE|nr:hypothetical protein AVEN_70654-1 [Araneus ventricosus]GBN60474.1 hypothetical protein AVEN_176753-1 [Araneus ventricosus]
MCKCPESVLDPESESHEQVSQMEQSPQMFSPSSESPGHMPHVQVSQISVTSPELESHEQVYPLQTGQMSPQQTRQMSPKRSPRRAKNSTFFTSSAASTGTDAKKVHSSGCSICKTKNKVMH